MTQDTETPDVSYVTELQRRWIERTYGADWDKPRVGAIDRAQSIFLDVGIRISIAEFDLQYKTIIGNIPDEYRCSATVEASCDGGYDTCYLNIEYARPETEREFNQRIASYLHRWERLRDEHAKDAVLFEMRVK